MMDTFLGGYSEKDRDNENGSSKENKVRSSGGKVCKTKCRKYDTKYMHFGFTDIDVDGKKESIIFTLYDFFWLTT
jgi:hypothetical protein